jgi:hypothetical protein
MPVYPAFRRITGCIKTGWIVVVLITMACRIIWWEVYQIGFVSLETTREEGGNVKKKTKHPNECFAL